LNKLVSQRLLRLALASVLLISLAACVVAPTVPLETKLAAFPDNPANGTLLIKSHVPQGLSLAPFAKWQSISVVNTASKQTYYLPDQQGNHSHYSAHVGMLPPGTYTLSSFHAWNGNISYSFPLSNRSSFKIEADTVTDLGTLLTLSLGEMTYTSLRHSSQRMIVLTDPAHQEAERITALLPKQYARQNVQHTQASHPEHKKLPPLAQLKPGLSRLLQNPVQDQDGRLYFGEELGIVSMRDAQGKWSWFDTDLLHRINALAVLPDQTLVAGADQGMIRFHDLNRPGPWQSAHLPLLESAVKYVGHHPKLGVYAVAQHGQDLVLLATPDLAQAQWRELARHTMEPRRISGVGPQIFAHATGVTMMIPYVGWTLESTAVNYDIATGKVTVKPMENAWSGWTHALSATNDGSVFTFTGSGISPGIQVSANGGMSWQDRSVSAWVRGLFMQTAQKGYLIKTDSMLETRIDLWHTQDGAKTWQKIAALPQLPRKLIPLQKDGELLMLNNKGEIYFSGDYGKTWVQDKQLGL